LLLLLALPVLLLAYAFAIEPYWIVVTHHAVHAPQGVHLTAPLRIAHLTDLHTAGLGRREKRLLAILAAEQPDLIVITGDTPVAGSTHKATREVLTRLAAPLGVYLVRGNWENWMPPGNEREHYRLAGVALLVNSGQLARPDVWLAGTDDPASGSPDMRAALRGAPAGALRVGLFHAPAYFDTVARDLHLALAGHTHGGQVRLPLLAPLWLPRASGEYVEGWFARQGARLYVSRGVGMSILPFRFLCRPEVAIITVLPAKAP
jgi:hypothetical protein